MLCSSPKGSRSLSRENLSVPQREPCTASWLFFWRPGEVAASATSISFLLQKSSTKKEGSPSNDSTSLSSSNVFRVSP